VKRLSQIASNFISLPHARGLPERRTTQETPMFLTNSKASTSLNVTCKARDVHGASIL